MALTKKQKAVVSRWVKALRSGKYKQGKQFLHRKSRKQERYCCLGVLCELAVHAKVISQAALDDDTFYYDHNEQILPTAVKNWVGLNEEDGSYGGGSLVELNDDGKKFTTIAKLIESKPEGLFV